jgi:hypothetical protein
VIINVECRLLECDSVWVFLETDVSEHCQFLQEPHGVTSQNTAFFVVTAAKRTEILRRTNRLELVAEK